jgi:hypothetical protein
MLETVELISRRDDELASQAQHPDLQPIEFLLLTYVETEPQQPEPQLLEPPGVVINRIETRMEELSVAADGVRVWLRNYDFTHGGQAPAGGALDRITLLAYLSRIYQKISEEADREELQDRYSFIVEEARAGRDQAIEEALALIDTLPEEIKANIYSVPEYLSEDTNTMINRWYIALLGERGEDLLMRSIERCNATEHERAQCDRSPPTSLSFRLALLLNQSTHERMLRVISRMPRGYQLDMVDDCIRDGVLGFDCRDSIETDQNSEFYRVYRAYNELRSNPRFERTIVDPNQDETVYYLERAVLDPANFERTPISFDEFREIVRATRVRYDLDSQWETAFIIRFGFDFASQNTHLQLGPNQDRVGGATELAFFVPLRAWCLTLRDPLVSSDDIESLDFIIHRCHQ